MNLLVSFFPIFHVLFTFFFLDIFHISPPFPNCFPTPSPKEQTAPLCQWQTVTVLGDAEPWPKRRSLRPDGSWWILMTKYVGFSLLNHGEMVSGGCWKLFGDGINNVVSATHSTPEIHTVHIFEGYNDQPVFLLDLNLLYHCWPSVRIVSLVWHFQAAYTLDAMNMLDQWNQWNSAINQDSLESEVLVMSFYWTDWTLLVSVLNLPRTHIQIASFWF